eukprot:352421-Chlamydomonas_euryale.AAC.42
MKVYCTELRPTTPSHLVCSTPRPDDVHVLAQVHAQGEAHFCAQNGGAADDGMSGRTTGLAGFQTKKRTDGGCGRSEAMIDGGAGKPVPRGMRVSGSAVVTAARARAGGQPTRLLVSSKHECLLR